MPIRKRITQPPKYEHLCGNCVHYNAKNDTEGSCAFDTYRQRDYAPCDRWFGLEQLHAPLYGN